jgi:hypothetical protein
MAKKPKAEREYRMVAEYKIQEVEYCDADSCPEGECCKVIKEDFNSGKISYGHLDYADVCMLENKMLQLGDELNQAGIQGAIDAGFGTKLKMFGLGLKKKLTG